MSENEQPQQSQVSKPRIVWCVSVDSHFDPALVKTMSGNVLSISMIREMMRKGFIFKSVGQGGEEMKPAGMNSVSGLDKLPEFDV